MGNILSVEYPEGSDFIRVIFSQEGGVSIRPPHKPRSGDEVEGNPRMEIFDAQEIARLMGFAYRCGLNEAARRLTKAA